jgi:putative transposase
MRYNPDKHHRHTIRLPGYDYTSAGMYFITICTHQRECLLGEIVKGEMRLDELGQVVRSHWLKLPQYHAHLQLDAFVVMPNHIHGILVLVDRVVGAGLADNSARPVELITKPAPTEASAPKNHHGIPEIIRGFKTFSARRINQKRNIQGSPVWQRNYYEHIIRNEESLHRIRQYIHHNPLSWQQDQLHPNSPSTW